MENNQGQERAKSTTTMLSRISERNINDFNKYNKYDNNYYDYNKNQSSRTPERKDNFFERYPEMQDIDYLNQLQISREKKNIIDYDSQILNQMAKRKKITQDPCKNIN